MVPTSTFETYSFLTTTPKSPVGAINHERMPVLLTREEEFETWLRGTPDEALALAREYPPDQMRIVQEGFDKEDLLKAASGMRFGTFGYPGGRVSAVINSPSKCI